MGKVVNISSRDSVEVANERRDLGMKGRHLALVVAFFDRRGIASNEVAHGAKVQRIATMKAVGANASNR